MPKLTRVETDYRYYSVEVTNEQVLKARESDEEFEALLELVQDDMEMVRLKDGGIDYIIE
ncbi:hypothetical protein OAA18_00150 [bacterium]|jgi:hypothetical protein|nr:hypothetical protein [bacterium]